jgi:hypothetical protein
MITGFGPIVLGTVSTLTASAGLWLCVREYIRFRAERRRWESVERLAELHGPEVLRQLTDLAPKLRESHHSPTFHQHTTDDDDPDRSPVRRRR